MISGDWNEKSRNMRQMVFVPHYHGDGECLIGNNITGRLHSLDCSAIDMMREDHKIPTNGAGFTPCGWCHACGTGHEDIFKKKLKILKELNSAWTKE